MPTKRDFREKACRHLRAKTMYLFLDEQCDHSASEDGTLQYWCNRTQRCAGLDGGFVHFDKCGAGRSCCEWEV